MRMSSGFRMDRWMEGADSHCRSWTHLLLQVGTADEAGVAPRASHVAPAQEQDFPAASASGSIWVHSLQRGSLVYKLVVYLHARG